MYKNILSSNSNSKVINISSHNINGILDLKTFTRLEILDCSNNNLHTIVNFPDTLEELYCNDNYLNNLDGLPNSLIKLNCSHNNICCINNLPYNLIEINCKNNKLKYLNMLPENLEILNCSFNMIEKLEDLPNNLKKLNCSSNQIKSINYLPNNLKELNCSNNKIWKISKLPDSVEEFDCSKNEIEDEFIFVPNLINVYIQNNKIKSLNNLLVCTRIKILNCENNQIDWIDGLPDDIEEFIANNNYFEWIWNEIPKSLEVIGIEKYKLNDRFDNEKTLLVLDKNRNKYLN